MVQRLAVKAISTTAHISRHNKHPGIDGGGGRDTVAGVNTTSLSECDGDVLEQIGESACDDKPDRNAQVH